MMNKQLFQQLHQAQKASHLMPTVHGHMKDKALENIIQTLQKNINKIIEANRQDLQYAHEHHMGTAMIERLMLNEERIMTMIQHLKRLIHLEDPIGVMMKEVQRPYDLVLRQIRVPIGVLGIICESRVHVMVDMACLCIKSGNVCLFTGSKDTFHTYVMLTKLIRQAIAGFLPIDSVQIIEESGRQMIDELIHAHGYVDVIVPIGEESLISYVMNHATIPIIKNDSYHSHLYIDKEADIDEAIQVSIHANMPKLMMCHARETILVHQSIAADYLSRLYQMFKQQAEIRGYDRIQKIISYMVSTSTDFNKSHDDYNVKVKIVDSLQDAISHIRYHSTKHFETIVTENLQRAYHFKESLDSTWVHHHAFMNFTNNTSFAFDMKSSDSIEKQHMESFDLWKITASQYFLCGSGQVKEL